MSSEDPAPVLTLKERIAALQLAQAADSTVSRVPPSSNTASRESRPAVPKRTVSTPAATRDTSLPLGKSVNQSSPRPLVKQGVREEAPPPVPPRRQTQPLDIEQPPALPPRRQTDLSIHKKQSNDSLLSVLSGRSSVSAVSARTSFSAVTEGSSSHTGARFRIKAPEYDPAKLPTLPERRVQKQEVERDDEKRIPLRPTLSAPGAVPRLGVAESEARPPLPTRPQSQRNANTPARPPPLPSNRPMLPAVTERPRTQVPAPTAGSVIELDGNTFDDIVFRSGKPVFVDFYAPFCKCKCFPWPSSCEISL